MTQYRFKIALILLSLFIFACCRKYPENDLWFKNPRKLDPFRGHITKYEVNGIDSLDLLNYYYNYKYKPYSNIRQARFITQHKLTDHFGETLSYTGSGSGEPLTHEFVRQYKFIKITRYPDTTIFKKSLFIDSNIEWQILRLAKKGPFRIKTTLDNGNSYEIEITPE